MMGHLLEQLTQRLPELEWKMAILGESISIKSLPRGLFRYTHDYKPSTCLDEIKVDMKALSLQADRAIAEYLSQRIHQKISVLVGLCNEKAKQKKTDKKTEFTVRMLSTRQRWIQTLEQEVQALETQQQALWTRLNQSTLARSPELELSLKAELGQLEKKLTLAKERLEQAIA